MMYLPRWPEARTRVVYREVSEGSLGDLWFQNVATRVAVVVSSVGLSLLSPVQCSLCLLPPSSSWACCPFRRTGTL